MQFHASVPSLMLFLPTGMPSPAPPALSAWQVHLSRSPQRPPPPGRQPLCPSPPGYLCTLSMLLLWHLSHCILLVYMFVSPSRL
uniref:AWQG2491 n=1 Tax=Homo sapiens TaxID=9606 RepID=Q6UWR5_HUMAN|nr:AWQG2491 [Homo sapiens]